MKYVPMIQANALSQMITQIKGLSPKAAAFSVSKDMTTQPDYINCGPNNINTMPTNYIVWKMIQSIFIL